MPHSRWYAKDPKHPNGGWQDRVTQKKKKKLLQKAPIEATPD